MAIDKTYLLGKNITLGCGFDLQAKAPLDSRQVVPEYDGLLALITGDAAYEGMIVYDEGTKKTYQAQTCDPYTVTIGEGDDAVEKTYSLAFREFGISEEELRALIASETTAAMEFKGAATALPENPSKGDFYKVTTSFDVVEGETAKVGDSIVYDGEQWFIIPSGDDIEDTWRPVAGVDNDATLIFEAGDKLEKTVATDGTITYKHAAVDAPELLAENEQTRTYITEVETDGFGHITGYKTATENVEDTNTTYEFDGQAEESSVYFTAQSSDEGAAPVTIYLDAYSKNEADAAIKVVADDLADYAEAHKDDYNNTAIDAAVAAAKQAGEDAAAAVDTKLTTYTEAHADDYTNEQIDKAITDATGALGSMAEKDANDYYTTTEVDGIKSGIDGEIAKKLDTATYDAYIAGKEMSDEALKKYAEDEADAAQSAAEAKAAELDTALHSTISGEVATAKQEAIDAAKEYADGKNTTYTVAATVNPLEFTVTPSEGAVQTITLVAPTVDTGVMKVTAGTDIVVTPESGTGEVVVAHAEYTSGTIKAAEGTEEPNFLTSVTIQNGHVTSATVQTLKSAMESMTFIIDGGTATV